MVKMLDVKAGTSPKSPFEKQKRFAVRDEENIAFAIEPNN